MQRPVCDTVAEYMSAQHEDVTVLLLRTKILSYTIMTQQYLFFFSDFSFFQDGLKAAENLAPFIEKLASSIHTVNSSCFFSPNLLYSVDKTVFKMMGLT